MSWPRVLVALLAALLATCSACGATVEQRGDAAGGAGYPVTVTNCGTDITFDAAPSRVVSNDIGITEILFALGLTDRMAGYVLSDGHAAGVASSPWREDFDRVPRLAERINKEIVQGANADLVFAGWNYGFTETSGVTPDSLATLGIDSYLLSETCRPGEGTARGVMPPLQALYTDLRNLGRIFGVPERAEALIADYRATVSRAERAVPADRRPPRVFLFDCCPDQPLTSGRYAAAHEIITRAGGKNIFGDLDDSWTRVNWEAVVHRDPEVIVINDYGTPSAQRKIEFLRSYPPMADVAAVRNDRFFVMHYAELVESPRNPAAIASFAEYLGDHSY
ncbi:MAG: ABC transporter substrate-binding protein [Pseudonocardiaceae bacterium]|nr:ABC transporter substrate-binding protein [Pseudonocardiaceae bacterium]